MRKFTYKTLSIRYLTIEPQENILGTSIVDSQSSVIIPRGQKVDEYDFSKSEFIHEWKID